MQNMLNTLQRYGLLCVCVLWSLWGQAQHQSWHFATQPAKVQWQRTMSIEGAASPDSLHLLYLKELHAHGYWDARLDSCRQAEGEVWCVYLLGERWRLQLGNIEGLPVTWSLPPSLRRLQRKAVPFEWTWWQRQQRLIVEMAEDYGYPFAEVQVERAVFDTLKKIWQPALRLQTHALITFDSLTLSPDKRSINEAFLRKYLDIVRGTPFRRRTIELIDRRLQALGFLRLKGSPEVRFSGLQADLRLPVEWGNSSQIQGFLGFLPNEQDKGELLITGELSLRLLNLFRRASRLQLYYNKMRPVAEQLQADYLHRRLWGAFDAGVSLSLMREDTLFINVNRSLTLMYPLADGSYVKGGVGLHTSRLGFSPTGTKAEDFRYQETDYFYYLLGWQQSHLNDRWFPTQGWQADVALELGNKTIARNPFLPEAYYDTLRLRALQWHVQWSVEGYYPLSRRQVLHFKQQTALKQAPLLLRNEWERLGGLRSLRGFNENFFFTPAYALWSIEWQYLLPPKSYLLLLADYALLAEDSNAKRFYSAAGLGAGIQLFTRAGNFRLLYAIGAAPQQPFAFNRAKIHFGYVSVF
jgi:outer membrane protein assembly factor BamA